MSNADITGRAALLAGATGLVGRALLDALFSSDRYCSERALLRRTAPDPKPGEKLAIQEVNFARLPAALPAVNDVFIALGTTIKVAGSKEAFRKVDFDYVVNVARAARASIAASKARCRRRSRRSATKRS
jgi:uncharacterized protein YbjT (DUF2867 family)